MRRRFTRSVWLVAVLAGCSGSIEDWDSTNVNGRFSANGEFVPGPGGGAGAFHSGGGPGGGAGGSSGNSPGGSGASGSVAMQCNGELAAGPALLRRLSQTEYNNTVRDLLGDTSAPASDFVARPRATSSPTVRSGCSRTTRTRR
jgi:hypothetical protein